MCLTGTTKKKGRARQMNKEELVELVEKILEARAGTLETNSKLNEVDWDSIAMLSFISEVDSRLGVELNLDKLVTAETVGDLWSLIGPAQQ